MQDVVYTPHDTAGDFALGTSNIASSTSSVGGVGRNIADAFSRMAPQVPALLISVGSSLNASPTLNSAQPDISSRIKNSRSMLSCICVFCVSNK